MKRYLFLLSSIMIAASLSLITGCGKEDKKDTDPSSCLAGTWKVVESGKIKLLTFNRDKTGFEKQGDDSPSNFTWEMKDGKPVIKYAGQTAEWTFALDCKNNHLNVMGLMYSRE
ncbi:MAG: hypothetical protein CVV44_03245 [Spirochaetae bacterium HGW-Spirochaetae-1]|jgi:major membrane immunogen (membrane-anchored lipoprotein)|nr:MAG: hypothetical protein CVV44_03245 [Spirochaetae bacterium HGW-Spirochaetae-1]